ncbi:MAG: response regulator, partial [Symbiobacteriaceae bacterium]|nr:response regulator [Symbiobacteriaceae bacterium]
NYDSLLQLVNDAATTLLNADPEQFEATISQSLSQMAVVQGYDRVYIWQTDQREGLPIYKQVFGWVSPQVDQTKTLLNITGSDWLPQEEEWEVSFRRREYLGLALESCNPGMQRHLSRFGIKAILMFPAYLQDRFWGFVSFERCESEELCNEREAVILQSGSILFANAVERNHNLLQIRERLQQQQLMSSISEGFIAKGSIGDLIRNALSRMGSFLKAVRVLVAIFETNTDQSHPSYYWYSDPKYAPSSSQRGFSGVIRELFPRQQPDGQEGLIIICENTLTQGGGKFRVFFDRGGVRSFVCAPIYVERELWGVMSVEEHERFRTWNESDALLVSMVATTISGAVARDMLDRERSNALEQALQASRAKSDFLSNMSHEMRTPMNAIIGMTTIGKTSQTIEKKDYALDKIQDASRHLLGVINDILDMSKIEANKLELSLVTFDFEYMLQKVVNVINFRIDERRQSLYITIDQDLPRLLIGDDQRLAQVITNLLSNAVKFTPDEGTINLDARLLALEEGVCRLLVSVSDTGIGMSEEQKTRLFHSFEQADRGTARKFGGTGLGLAISKSIIEMMGGEIWVETELGVGSQFSFIVELQQGSRESRKLLADNVSWENIRIFAVDDEPEIREFFASVCSSLNIYCEVAASGEDAEVMLEASSGYDICFIDWMLPGMNRIELVKLIRSRMSKAPIITMFSSIDWSLIEDEARAAGVDRFLPKPLFPSVIVDLVNECFGGIKTDRVESTDGLEACFAGHCILLAEDVEINREIVLTLLEPTQLTIDCAENGLEALRLFAVNPERYELIFMDVQMPEMDGYEATRRIRDLDTSWGQEIPIVALTANVFREDIDRCLAAGMNAHLGKPLDFYEVIEILRHYLG